MLYRISAWFKPDMIIELGTGLGVSALYLGKGSPGIPVHTIEGNQDRALYASAVFRECGLEHVEVHVGDMDRELDGIIRDSIGSSREKRILAFVDGNHRYEPTTRYVRKLVEAAGEEAVVVLDDIYWSRGMCRAWKEIIAWPEVRTSIDLFHMGILLMRRDLNKAHVKIKF